METLIIKGALVLFFIYGILIIFAVLVSLFILIANSKIEIKIKDLDISTVRKEKLNRDYKIHINIIIFNKIKIFGKQIKKMKFKKENLDKLYNTVKSVQGKLSGKISFTTLIQLVKNLSIETKELDLKIELGTEDAAISAILVGIISSIIGIILRNHESKEQRFEVIPLYINQNILKLKLDGIFRINLIHYIYKNILKGRESNERKSSDRRAYAYNNE